MLRCKDKVVVVVFFFLSIVACVLTLLPGWCVRSFLEVLLRTLAFAASCVFLPLLLSRKVVRGKPRCGMLPRYGFVNEERPAASLGPGLGNPTGPRLAYGPGTRGGFESVCASSGYELPPCHVYMQGRTQICLLPPRMPLPPKFKPPIHRQPPALFQRLSIPKTPPREREPVLIRPQSQALLERCRTSSAADRMKRIEQKAGELSLVASKSVPTLQSALPNAPPQRVVDRFGAGSASIHSHDLKIIIEVEHCTAFRPTAALKGKTEYYVEAAERLEGAVTALATSMGCAYEIRVNPLVKVARGLQRAPDTPMAKLVAERQSAGFLAPALGSGYPRIGAFEVLCALELRGSGERIDTGLLYSKLQSQQWPNTTFLSKTLRERIESARLPPPSPTQVATKMRRAPTRPRPVRSSAPTSAPPPPSPPRARPTSAGQLVNHSPRGKQNIWAVFEAIDATELRKAARVAGLPEGRKEDMVKALISKFQSRVIVAPPKPKKRRRQKGA